MARLNLAITNDWELYGDGSGDFFEVQQRPLAAAMAVAEHHGVPLTVMAEVAQQWAHRDHAAEDAVARVAEAWDTQLCDAVRRGHDVQLHLHPQWASAHRSGGRWHLDATRWSLGALNEETVTDLLRRGRDTLETLLRPIDSTYACTIFRAGAFAIEPARSVLNALRSLGFRADSSVVAGLVDPPHVDFSRAPSPWQPWFATDLSVTHARVDRGPIVELPVLSDRGWDSALLRQRAPRAMAWLRFGVGAEASDANWQKNRRRFADQHYPIGNRGPSRTAAERFRWVASRAVSRNPSVLDVDLQLPQVAACMLDRAWTQAERAFPGDVDVPVVAIAHAKNGGDGSNLDRMLTLARRQLGERLRFVTLRTAADLAGAVALRA